MNFVSDNVPAPFKINSPFPVEPSSPLYDRANQSIQPKLKLRAQTGTLSSKNIHVRSNQEIEASAAQCNAKDTSVSKRSNVNS